MFVHYPICLYCGLKTPVMAGLGTWRRGWGGHSLAHNDAACAGWLCCVMRPLASNKGTPGFGGTLSLG